MSGYPQPPAPEGQPPQSVVSGGSTHSGGTTGFGSSAMGGQMGDNASLFVSQQQQQQSSYAARSAALMQQQQQPPMFGNPNSNNPTVPSIAVTPSRNAASMSYAERSQALQQHAGGPPHMQQQQQQQPPATPPQAGIFSQYHSQMQQQPAQMPPQQQPPVQQQQTPQTSSVAGGSYAARSAALMQQQQPAFGYGSGMYGSTSGQGMYGQQQQQQPSYGSSPGMMGSSAPPANQIQYRSPATPQQQQTQAQPQSHYGLQNQGNVYGGGGGTPQPQQQPQMQQQPQAMSSSYYGGGGTPTASQTPAYGGGGPSMSQSVQPSSVQQQPSMGYGGQSTTTPYTPGTPQQQHQQQQPPQASMPPGESPAEQAQQARLLTDATRKVQEHAYYMKQAMDQQNLPAVLDRAAQMVGELGEHAHAHHNAITPNHQAPGAPRLRLQPKTYYELHLRALEDLPALQDYLLNLSQVQPSSNNNPPPTQQGQAPYAAPGQQPYGMPPQQGLPIEQGPFYTMQELYDIVQYCPNVLSRLYLQICAAGALIRSGQVPAKDVLADLNEAVKCVQNPVRGLFLRHYLLQALRNHLPDVSSDERNGTVQDSYQFILGNFIEMNKLWVRIQHLPGDGKDKAIRRRRERERNDLRLLVGTNLVRLSQLEGVTSSVYGQFLLPRILDHIVVCNDPLAQAYLMDCITQVFPDEYHIETMPILLGVCPKLRDKVNIRTILQSLMDRLANYLADEELLDEADTNNVKKQMAQDSFGMIYECIQNVYHARGPKLTAKEVVRLQTALLGYSIKCFPNNVNQVVQCLAACVQGLQQTRMAYTFEGQQQPQEVPMDEVATKELEKFLSIPLDTLALDVLKLEHYASLISFLPWNARRQLAWTLVQAVRQSKAPPKTVAEVQELLAVMEPMFQEGPSEAFANGTGAYYNNASMEERQKDVSLASSLIHMLEHDDTDIQYEMLMAVKSKLNPDSASGVRGQSYVAVVFALLRLAGRIAREARPSEMSSSILTPKTETEETHKVEDPDEEEALSASGDMHEETNEPGEDATDAADASPAAAETTPTADADDVLPDTKASEQLTETDVSEPSTKTKATSSRQVFVLVQQIVASVAHAMPELAVKMYLDAALTADSIGDAEGKLGRDTADYVPIVYELIAQAFVAYEENVGDSRLQTRCIVSMIACLYSCRSLPDEDYAKLVMKVTTYSAKLLKKSEQCEMVTKCSNLFYVVGDGDEIRYSNPQRALECLQRALKLADTCTTANPSNLKLFVDLLDQYLFFFEKKNPSITGNYISGLTALIKDHADNLSSQPAVQHGVLEAKNQFILIVRYIKKKKMASETAELFASVDVDKIAV